ncbi:ABC transporter substrate-binding protein [Methanospirillum stamsii]|uniref:ABC transporter substrate-binding protein n=1 Tax=Methanospirillum stamsii TaxID=1277351 RepID=A0A2V2NKX1_9EURY|nr:ABC transporter substrate-binding protein [Methanospirillum stamsii]
MKRLLNKPFIRNTTKYKSKRITGIISVLVCFLTFITLTCPLVSSTDMEKPTGDTSVTIIDDWGRTVTLDKPAERIAFSHTATADGILLAGGWDKVVGREGSLTDPDTYPNLDSIPAIDVNGQCFDLDFEKITEIHPDLVILQKYYSQKEGFDEIASKLEPDIPVIGLDFLDPESAESIKKLGILLGTSDVADEYVNFHDDVIKKIKEKTQGLSDDEKPNVFIDGGGMGTEQISTYGKEASFWEKMCEVAGGKNVASSLSGDYVTSLDMEWLLEQDIDSIMAQAYYEKGKPSGSGESKSFGYKASDPSHAEEEAESILNDVKNLDVYSNTDAVKNNNVHLQYWELACTPKAFIGTAYLAKWLHPDLFTDLDPEQIHQEYLTKYLGTNYDLKNLGIFAYPC